MARNITVGALVTAIRQRADVENFANPTTAEVKALLSSSYTWLYDILVRSGHSYFESTDDWATDGVTGNHALPSAFYAKLRVDRVEGTNLYPVRELDIRDLQNFTGSGGYAGGHRIVGTNVVLYPTPGAGQTYRLTFIPAAADLSAALDAVTIDGIDGFEELVIVDAAIKIRRKEGDNETYGLERDLKRLLDRVEENAQNRELLRVGRIRCADDDYIDGQAPRERPWWWS